MNRLFPKFLAASFALTAFLSQVPTVLGVPFTAAFSENFDSMGASATTPPPGWSLKTGDGGTNTTWTSSITAGGATSVASMTAAAGALTATASPTGNNNNSYNAAASAGNLADRLLATAPTGVTGAALQLQLTNTSGASITAIEVGYDIRRYTAVGTANELPGYWLFYSLDNGATWTNVAALNPTLAGPAGVIVPNTAGVTTVPATTVALASTWASGADLLLRWVDDNAAATSPDQIIGLDNVSVAVSTAGVRSIVTSITEDFNSIGTSGTTLPNAWTMKNANGGSNSTWADPSSSPIPASGTTSVATMVAATGALTVNNAPGSTNNNGYNAQGATAADRVVATAPTGAAGVAIQLQLRNHSGHAVNGVQVSYDIRRYTAVSTANELPGYWLFYSLDNGASWTNVAALNPALAGSAAVLVPNTVGVTTVAPTIVTLGATWADGADLLLRWVDDNAVATSPDQIIGLDNVTVALAAPIVGAPPAVTLTAPGAADSFVAPATVHLAAEATDTDGTIVRVEFFNGATKLGEAATAPFSYDWTGVAAGAYHLTARAKDNDGNTTSSAPVSVTVNPAPGSGALTRGPYLQKAAPTQMTVRWRSSQSVAGRVRYGTDQGNLDQAVDEAVSRTEHEVILTGLTAATRYYYSIGSSLDTIASGADYTFATSPVAGTPVNTRIWVLGDAGTANSNQTAVRDAFYTWTGARTPDFVLQLGDNAYNAGTDAEFQGAVFTMYAAMLRKTPFWSCLGNHETDQATAFVDTYPYFNIYSFPTAGEAGGVPSGTEHYYSFDYGNIHVISLDSMTASRSATGAMATWLQNDLASTTATWIVCIFHHPPYTKGSHNSDTETELIQMRQNILPILEAGGVDLVLSGHSHAYERSYLIDGHYGSSTTFTNSMKIDGGDGRPAGTGAYLKPLTGPRDHFGAVYSVAGSSGQTSGGSLNHPAHFISLNNLGSLVLDVNGTRLDATFLRENRSTPDTFSIIKQGAADKDGDGIPDEYEIANGLNRGSPADADLDLDGDGLSNRLEYDLGTAANAANRTGLPVLGVGTGASAGKLTLTFNRARTELSYTVQASDDLKVWSDLATNPGAPGADVTVVDTNTTSPNRFLRLRVTDGASPVTTVPVGRMTYTFAQNQETAVSFPLHDVLGPIDGQPAGFITAVTASTLDAANAGWAAGQLSQAATPYLLRITSGAAVGRVFPVATATPNTATRLALATGGVDLTTLGIASGSDTFELIPADTLATLFPTGTLLSGSATSGDTLRLWDGAAWVTFFHDGTAWQQQGGGPADTTLMRPDQGWMLRRRGAAKTLVLYGQAPSTDAKVAVVRGGSSYVSLLPVPQTFAEFQLQNRLTGWSSNPASPTSGDYVSFWNGSLWLNYYYDGTKWLRQGVPGDAGATVFLKPGRPVLINRPAGTGGDLLSQPRNY